MASIRRDSLSEQVAEALRARIVNGEWSIGEKLEGEAKLAADLGVGRSTIREAIRALAAVGVLESRQGLGVYVRSIEAPRNWEDLLESAAITDVIDARIAIESDGARLAAQRRTPADLKLLEHALDIRNDVDPDDLTAHVRADHKFHHTVLMAAHSPVLLELFTVCMPRSEAGMVSLLVKLRDARPPVDADRHAHHHLYEAISQGDEILAEQVSRTHLEGLRSLWTLHTELPTTTDSAAVPARGSEGGADAPATERPPHGSS